MKDDIIRIAKEAGFYDGEIERAEDAFVRFVALIADAEAKRIHNEGMVTVGHMREQIAAEREACARVADEWSKRDDDVGAFIGKAIRARGQA